MAFQTQCPHCGKVLKLKSEAAVGRKAPCPKCRTPFVVEPYEEPPADEWNDAGGEDEYGYDYSDDDYGDYGDEYGVADGDYAEAEPAPSRSSRKSGAKGSKKKKKAAGAPAWLAPLGIGLAILVGLGLLGGGVAFLISRVGGSRNVVDLAWLPADGDMYLLAKPGEMWNAPILEPLRDNPAIRNAMGRAGQNGQLDLKPEDIATVTLAGVDMFDMMSARVPLFGGRATATGQVVKRAEPKQIAVMRLNRDLTQEELAAVPGAQKKTHGSAEYYLAGTGRQTAGFYLADARTLLTGTESELTKAIDRGNSQERVARIDFANVNHQFVMVLAPPNPLRSETSAASGATAGDRLGSSINRGARAMAFGLSLGQNIALQFQVDCFDGESATAIQTDFDAAIAEAKRKLGESSAMIPEPLQGLVAVMTQSL
jgi:phage FluMu protein Com